MRLQSHEQGLNAREAAWERAEAPCDEGLECHLCGRELTVGDVEAGEYRHADVLEERVACWPCWEKVAQDGDCEGCFGSFREDCSTCGSVLAEERESADAQRIGGAA